jgi:hypothetical protein
MAMTDERLTKHEAAEYLGRTVPVSPRTLDAGRYANKGPRSHKMEGRVFWLKSDCAQWLSAQLISTARDGVR